MTNYVNPLTLVDACLLVESMNKPFHIGPAINNEIQPHHIDNGITDYREHDIDHGREGRLTIFKRNRAYEIHRSDWGDNDTEQSGKFISNRSGPNPRFVATMGHVANNLLDKGHSVSIVDRVSNGMFDRYRRLGVLLAKRYGRLVTNSQRYTLDHPDSDDLKEFTIQNYVGESPIFLIKSGIVNNATYENDYHITESFKDSSLHFGFESE
jgi:hypothetical protein